MASRESSASDPIRDLLDEKSLADEISKAIEGNDCPRDDELGAYARGELGEPERIEVKSHLTFCGRCRKRLDLIADGSPPDLEKTTPPMTERRFLMFRLPLPATGRSVLNLRTKLLILGAAAPVFILALYLLFFRSPGEFPYTGRVVQAQGQDFLRRGQQTFFELRAPRPVFLIEITIDGDGKIDSRIAPGPRQGKFQDRDRVGFTPAAAGDFDLYLVPSPADEGYPDRLHNGLNKFIKTDTALSRENQRTGIEVALGLYRAQFIHEVYRISP